MVILDISSEQSVKLPCNVFDVFSSHPLKFFSFLSDIGIMALDC